MINDLVNHHEEYVIANNQKEEKRNSIVFHPSSTVFDAN